MPTSSNQPVAEILIVEDEVAHAEALSEGLSRIGHRCTVVHDGADAITKLNQAAFDIIITDLMLGPGPDGLAVLDAAREIAPAAKTILITAHSTVDTCRTALRNGAFDYIEKPLALDDLRAVVGRAAELTAQKRTLSIARESLDESVGFEHIVGESAPMLAVLDTLRRVAQSDIPVLLLGESGTGKELFATAVHQNSPRAAKPFVAINCAGLSETLLEDELFGHVRGAYTGATSDRPGRFEHADGGTLFLDEIGDMPAAMQAKLLRVLENGEVIRVGANEPIRVDVRIVSATNADLDAKVREKTFREDLYYRIKGATITIPPLRKRRDDIGLLLDHFMQLARARHATQAETISPEARRLLMAYPWPGNVRQLRNVVENMMVLATGTEITPDVLPEEIHSRPKMSDEELPQIAGISIAEAERQLIKNTLELTDGKREKAAQLLGIGERTLYRKIKEYEL